MITFITGFLMAIADSVPGVSGSTIAYILEQYELLIKHVNNILKKDFNKESISFLIKLIIGWGIGFILAITIISSLFESHIYEISSLFLGLIIASIIIVGRNEKEIVKNEKKNILVLIIGVLIVYLLVNFQTSTNIIPTNIFDFSVLTYMYLFIVGMVAMSAMLLPGISGSSVFVIFGAYYLIVDGIDSLIHLDFTYFGMLSIIGIGALVGAFISIKIISKLFETKRGLIIYLILGLLIGSIFAIIQGPTSISVTNQPLQLGSLSIIYFIIGILLLVILEFISKSTKRK